MLWCAHNVYLCACAPRLQYIRLFGNIPTDDVAAWRVGWFDRPERQKQKDLQKYWINHPPHWEWMKEPDTEKRFELVRRVVEEVDGPSDYFFLLIELCNDQGNGPRGRIIDDKSLLWDATSVDDQLKHAGEQNSKCKRK